VRNDESVGSTRFVDGRRDESGGRGLDDAPESDWGQSSAVSRAGLSEGSSPPSASKATILALD
jgi:hypothetical protein